MRFFGYLDKDTFIHRLDPRTKIIGLFLVSGLLFTFNHPLYLCAVFALALALCAWAGIMHRIWQLRYLLLVLALVSTLTWPFYLKSGTLLFSIGAFQVTDEAFFYGTAMGLRWAGAIVVGMIFLSTIRPDDFYAGMVLMKMPYVIAFVISLTFRLAPTFIGVGVEIREAQVSRGLDMRAGGLISRLRKYMSLAVPLFMHAIRQANMMTVALESRAFGSRMKRTFYRQYKLEKRDFVALGAAITLLALCIILRYAGFGVYLNDRL